MLKKYAISFLMTVGLFLIFPVTANADGCAMPLLSVEESKDGYAKVTWESKPTNIEKNSEDDVWESDEDEDEYWDEDWDDEENVDEDAEEYTDEDDTPEENPNIYAIYRKEGDGKFKLIDFVERKKGEKQQYYEDKTSKKGVSYAYSVAGFNLDTEGDCEECMGSTHKETDENDKHLIWVTCKWDKFKELTPIRYLVFVNNHMLSNFKTDKRKIKFYISGWKKEDFPDVTLYGISKDAIKNYNRDGVSIKLSPLKKSTIKKARIVATNKARIDWTESPAADGYEICRRTGKKWTIVDTITGGSQTYCYDSKVKKNTEYYYTIKPFQKVNKEKRYATWDETGTRIKFNKTTINPKKGDYSAGTVYGPSLNAKQRGQVKKTVKSFFHTYVTSDMNTLEKLIVAQAYMSYSCIYAETWRKNGANTAWGSLVYKNKAGLHEAQCSGYARGFKALCDAMGVTCRYVHANSKSANSEHQWCMVKVSGKWYIIDPQGNSINYVFAYFLDGKRDYQGKTMMAWDVNKYPKVSKKSYSEKKISKASSDYKVIEMVKKIQKRFE